MKIAKAVKDAVQIPVIVSGDCVDKASYERIIKATGADGVMIARGALGRPEVFAEILGEEVNVNKLQDIFFHMDKLSKYFSEKFVVLNMRTHVAFYLKRMKVAPEIKRQLLGEESLSKVKQLLTEIFQK